LNIARRPTRSKSLGQGKKGPYSKFQSAIARERSQTETGAAKNVRVRTTATPFTKSVSSEGEEDTGP